MNANLLQYIQQHNIDREKWDACIIQSTSPLIYAQYDYLQVMASRWDALVYGDYEIVMPLTWRKKFGIRYLYQPAFTQQLGIFSKSKLSGELINQFLIEAARQFHFAEIFLNECNDLTKLPASDHFPHGLKCIPRSNFTLSLNDSHAEIQKHYREAVLRNIRKAKRAGLVVKTATAMDPVIESYRVSQQENMKHLSISDYKNFSKLCEVYASKKLVISKNVVNNQNEILAGAVLLNDGKRVYNIITHITPQGRDLSANHLLYDELLQELAGTGILFDFEGSEIPGVRNFYQGFGATNRPYYFLRFNELPWPIRKLKNA